LTKVLYEGWRDLSEAFFGFPHSGFAERHEGIIDIQGLLRCIFGRHFTHRLGSDEPMERLLAKEGWANLMSEASSASFRRPPT
jgi:hypothetical protein